MLKSRCKWSSRFATFLGTLGVIGIFAGLIASVIKHSPNTGTGVGTQAAANRSINYSIKQVKFL